MILKIQSQYITLDTYKKYTKQEFIKWDEKFISIIFTYERDYFYIPKK